tara:strand:+ start:254 stop:1585 length:1332 start_codon:yes stop_codon:yes gene_type:complete
LNNYLSYQSEKKSNDIFIRSNNQEYSFSDMNNIIYDRASGMADFGVCHNHKVAIFLSDPFDFIESYLACYQIQATSVILNYHWDKEAVQEALKMVKPDFIICKNSDKKLFTTLKHPLIFIEELSKSFGSCAPLKMKDKIEKENIQSILFTSGSSGFPKPVCLTYDNFYQSSIKWKKAINLEAADQYLACLPLYHVGGLAIIMRALHIGFSININMDIKNYGIRFSESSVISLVPTLLIDLIKNPHSLKNLKKLRCIILSGAKVPMKLLSDCKENNLNIFVSYGMTETCSSICGFWLSENSGLEGAVGYPFEGVKVNVENDQVIIESNTVMKHYFNHRDTSGVFSTSDKGRIKDNCLILDGRLDDIIISGGENVSQNEVVDAILKIDSFDRVVPFKKDDPYWGEIGGVYIYTDKEINASYIKAELAKIISRHKIPKEIIIKEKN